MRIVVSKARMFFLLNHDRIHRVEGGTMHRVWDSSIEKLLELDHVPLIMHVESHTTLESDDQCA